jgi:hypothetical protein
LDAITNTLLTHMSTTEWPDLSYCPSPSKILRH